jgi:NAD(P)-dependent dehydrogenase (short-subunit alcohol dehydrogenase family)
MGDRGWTATDVPDQHGRRIVVTGANSGIGLEAARVLATRGAEVILACRDLNRGATALGDLKRQWPAASARVEQLDLADLSSVRSFAERVGGQRIDVLVANAGVMAARARRTTVDGFELLLGTNHLGHVALTLALLPAMLDGAARTGGPPARVVVVTSRAHTAGRIDFDDLGAERRYRRYPVYCRSKLANLLFALELQRRLAARSLPALAVACHPGYAGTRLMEKSINGSATWLEHGAYALGRHLIAQSPAAGAWPTLRAATDPAVVGGELFGPSSLRGLRGRAVRVTPSPAALDPALARRLWEVSVELTGADPGPLGR